MLRWKLMLVVLILLGLSACDVTNNPNRTPTVAVSPTPDETEIALEWTDTPSPTASNTASLTATVTASRTSTDEPSNTPSPSLTATDTDTATATTTASSSPTATQTATDTPSVTPSPTPSDTATATATPSPSNTATATTTGTSTPSLTPSPTDTPTATATNTATHTPTPTPSQTNTATATNTATQTNTPTATSTDTATFTPSPSFTATETLSPTPSATNTDVPTSTSLPTRGPSNTPSPTPTASITASPTVTQTPSPTVTVTPTSTVTVTLTPSPAPVGGDGLATATDFPTATEDLRPTVAPINRPSATITLFPSPNFTDTPVPTAVAGSVDDPNAPTGPPQAFASATPGIIFLNTPVQAQATNTPFGLDGNTNNDLPSGIIIRRAGGGFVTALGDSVAGWEGALAYDVGPQGQSAAYYGDGEFYVNGAPLRSSPASEYGLGADKAVTDIAWSPNGGAVAFVISGQDPSNQDRGVWVHYPGANSQQILRLYEREAVDLRWAPDNALLLARLQTTTEEGYVYYSYAVLDLDFNTAPREVGYPQATWALDGRSIIFSGANIQDLLYWRWNGDDWQEIRVPITTAGAPNFFKYCAIESTTGQLLLLGASAETGPFQLYRVSLAGGSATPIAANDPPTGFVSSCEWDANRSTLLVVLNNNGTRTAYLFWANSGVNPIGTVTGPIRWR